MTPTLALGYLATVLLVYYALVRWESDVMDAGDSPLPALIVAFIWPLVVLLVLAMMLLEGIYRLARKHGGWNE